MPREALCDICGKCIPSGHLQRHRSTKHKVELAAAATASSPPPIQLASSIREVLERCGIAPDQLGDWNVDELHHLPNLRLCRPKPRRHHTPWDVTTCTARDCLPTLESLLMDISYRARTPRGIDRAAQVYNGKTLTGFTSSEWVTWAKRVMERGQVLERVLNLPMRRFMSSTDSQPYRDFAADTIRGVYQVHADRDVGQAEVDANITPRLTKTEVHHDSLPHVSTAFGMAACKDEALKLWLIWPSTELSHLMSCYGDTKTALREMDHGAFLVQMDGDAVRVPSESPHAVFALNTCCLCGTQFPLHGLARDPPATRVDIAGGISAINACENRVEQLEAGLGCDTFRQAHLDQFLQLWLTERATFHKPEHDEQLRRLVAIWTDHLDKNPSCVWCAFEGLQTEMSSRSDHTQHVKEHLTVSKRKPNSSSDEDDILGPQRRAKQRRM